MNSRLLRTLGVAGACALAVLATPRALGQPIGQWDFNAGTLSATVGSPLAFVDSGTESETRFGTTTSFGLPDIGGAVANVMRYPVSDPFGGFQMPVNSAGNGGGTYVNRWTIVMDLLWPAEADGLLRGLMETDMRTLEPDSDLFVSATGGLGVDGKFDGQIRSNTWYRIGFVVDASNDQLRKYINGTLVGVQSATSTAAGALDGRWALNPMLGAQLFNDDSNPPEASVGFVNSIQFRNVALTSAQISALGGPTAAGVPVSLSIVLESQLPHGGIAVPTTDYRMVLSLGDNQVNPASVSMRLNGTVLTGTSVDITDGRLTVSGASTGPLPIGSDNVLAVSLTGSADGARTFNNSFRVVAFFEDFESVALGPNVDEGVAGANVWSGEPPTGWTVDDSGVPGAGDPSTDGVTEWAGWGFANRSWWASVDDQTRSQFQRGIGTVAIADPDEWDDQGHSPGLYNARMSTPSIAIAGIAANSMFLRFDSSWRPECCDDGDLSNNQTAVITASFDGGSDVQVLHWSSRGTDADFHPDSQNEGVTVPVPNPAGATTVKFTFGLTNAANDWWWAVDNITVGAGPQPPTITSQPNVVTVTEGELASLAITVTGAQPLSFQWYRGSGVSRTPIAGATSATLNIPNARQANAGIYTVQVNNAGGTVDSSNIELIVIPGSTGSVTEGLVVHLKFDGDSIDSSGKGNNGTEVGAPTYVEGRLGQALRYSNAKDSSFFNYVSLGMAPDLEFGTSVNFSIAFWSKFTTWTGDPAFIANKNWGSGGNQGYVIATAGDGRLQWNAAPNRIDYDGPGGTMSDDQWHHVVFSWDRTGFITTYLDGFQVNNTPNGAERDLTSGLPTNIGQDGTGTYTDGGDVGIADGTIDDVGIWRRALSEGEVKAIYRAALSGKDLSQAVVAPPIGNELVVYLPFDGNLTDSSGRGNNGTSVGNTPFVSGRLNQAVAYSTLAGPSSFNYVTLGRPADLNFGTSQSFAVSFWTKLNSWSGDPAFIANKDWDSGSQPGWVIATDGDGRVQWNMAGTNNPAGGVGRGFRRDYDSAGGIFSDNGWHHVVVAWERLPGSGRARTYIDGRRLAETTWSGPDNQLDSVDPRNTNIGQDGFGDYAPVVDGTMDELVLWRRALVDDEVSGLYAAGVLGVPANGANPGLTLQLPPGKLQIAKINNGASLRLTWTANAGIRLQQSTSLGDTANWRDVRCTLSAGQYETPADTANTFYRLRRR